MRQTNLQELFGYYDKPEGRMKPDCAFDKKWSRIRNASLKLEAIRDGWSEG